jgi:hypothetical protein
MTSTGLVNALYQWAKGSSTKIAQLVTERDALVTGFLSGGKDCKSINSATLNGKSFGALVNLSKEDKLAVLTATLERLGEIVAEPTAVHANFRCLQR